MSRTLRKRMHSVVGGLQSAAHYWSASHAPLDTDGAHRAPSLLSRSLEEIKNVVDEGPPFSISDLPAYIDAVTHINGTIDDRKYLLEKILTLMARLGKNVEFSQRLEQLVIDILYKDLPHPPCSYLALPAPSHLVGVLDQPGDPAQPVTYAYRAADGSHYNPLIPSLGMAGSPYARSVPSQRSLSRAALPPPELVFDTLLKRDKFVPHPGGISSLFFAFADIIIHNVFNTDPNYSNGWTTNLASSYLDLSPLYGTSQDEVNSVRRLDGTGKLHDDVFADVRLLNMPPAVCAILILFNRNHNYVAEKILCINENGNLKNPPPTDPKAQDEEIFQRARLVNTGYFIQVILRDYVGAILGLVRDGSPWRLDPLMSTRDPDHEVTPRGQGNVVSVEFNLLYRWHATVSEEDTSWTEKHFADTMPSFDPKTGSVYDFMKSAGGVLGSVGPVTQRTFGGLTRDPENGRFKDADLARILQNATAAPASAFKARGTPEVLRVIEILSIIQGRKWGVCTLNEFRKFMGLKPYKTFEEWNDDKEIARAAEALYHDIDNLELHVGMQAEQPKTPQPGAGLCPGFTISRAILSDAVALTRGDRFLTVDFTPLNLTAWGFDDCQANTSDGSYGGMLTKLLFRHLPDYYPSGSTYAHFPFLVPGRMKGFAQELLGDVDLKYDWNRPTPPVGPTVVKSSYSEVQQLFSKPVIFSSGVAQRLEILTRGVPLKKFSSLVEDVLTRPKSLEKATDAFERITQELIKQAASKGVGPYLDVVREVINLIPVHWLSNDIIGLPLKSATNLGGVFTEQELSKSLANIANYVYCNKDRENEWVLREQSQKAVHDVEPFLRGNLARLTRGSVNIDGITDSVLRWVSTWKDQSDRFLRDLVEATGSQSGISALDGLAGSLLAAVVPTAALFSQIIAQVVDFYIDPDRAKQAEQIAQLAKKGKNTQVMPFIFEALRLNPVLSSVLLEAQSPAEITGTVVAKRQHVLANIVGATRDASTFQNPDTANYARPPAVTECILGLDRRGLLSPKLFEQVAPVVLGEIFSLKNLRRYPPKSGPMARCTEKIHTVPEKFYTDLNGRVAQFPVSLFVQFDE